MFFQTSRLSRPKRPANRRPPRGWPAPITAAACACSRQPKPDFEAVAERLSASVRQFFDLLQNELTKKSDAAGIAQLFRIDEVYVEIGSADLRQDLDEVAGFVIEVLRQRTDADAALNGAENAVGRVDLEERATLSAVPQAG